LVGIGTKRHFAALQQTVALGGKADIGSDARNDAFDPKRTSAVQDLCSNAG